MGSVLGALPGGGPCNMQGSVCFSPSHLSTLLGSLRALHSKVSKISYTASIPSPTALLAETDSVVFVFAGFCFDLLGLTLKEMGSDTNCMWSCLVKELGSCLSSCMLTDQLQRSLLHLQDRSFTKVQVPQVI